MENAIQKAKHQITEIRKQQRVEYEAYSAVNETVSEPELQTISEEPEDAMDEEKAGR